MALNLANQYPGKTIPATAAYPYGSGRNVTVQGDGSGTPYEQAWFNDLQGFLQAVLQAGSVVPSGTPDSAVVSDYLTALRALFLNTGNLGTDDGDIPQIGTPGVDAAGDRSAVVVRSGSNANGSYRVWSDGHIEQWGRRAWNGTTTSVVFPLVFAVNDYALNITIGNADNRASAVGYFSTQTISGFSVRSAATDNSRISFSAIGF